MYLVLLFFLAAVVAHGNADEKLCPPPTEILPCTCFKADISARWTALCKNITTATDISDVFERNPNWNLQDVHIDDCTMSYIPAIMLEKARFQSINVSSSILDTLFDVPPKRTPELNLYLHSLRLLRGFEWKLFANSSLKDFGAFNTEIRNFGSTFKDSMPHDVARIWFEGTNTRSIKSQAFEHLKVLEILTIKKALLKTISRNMFPKPWEKIWFLDFSYNKIMTLPDDIFDEMPKLGVINLERNLLTTLSERIFNRKAAWGLANNPFNCNCNMKWITTSKVIDKILLKGTCAEPDSVKGKNLEDLTEKGDFGYCT